MYFNYVPRPVPEPTNLSERLATVLGGLRDIAALHAGRNWALIPVTLLFSAYLGSVIRRFTALAARLADGPLRTRPPRPAHSRPAGQQGPRKSRLPGRFAWVVDWLGYHAAGRGSQLRYLLTEDAEMAALLAASPQGGRILRPLCRMMGIAPTPDLPPSLFPPRDPKPADVARHEPAMAASAPSAMSSPPVAGMGWGRASGKSRAKASATLRRAHSQKPRDRRRETRDHIVLIR